MYNNLTLYYLNQIGITPWVNRAGCSNNKIQVTAQKTPKLIVIKQSYSNKKALSLLNKMIDYLSLKEPDILMVETSSSEQLPKESAPLALLVFGQDSREFLSNCNYNCPVLSSLSPDDLLKNPIEKKAVFKVLHSIKELISQN